MLVSTRSYSSINPTIWTSHTRPRNLVRAWWWCPNDHHGCDKHSNVTKPWRFPWTTTGDDQRARIRTCRRWSRHHPTPRRVKLQGFFPTRMTHQQRFVEGIIKLVFMAENKATLSQVLPPSLNVYHFWFFTSTLTIRFIKKSKVMKKIKYNMIY
jgi:hypothetical protein